MSFIDAHQTKERIRQAVDIVELVGSSIPLHRSGRTFVGLCPWHDDTRPSLRVDPERQSWKCWVCNIGGDVFSYVMHHDKVEFPEAVRILADRAGIEPPTAPGGRTVVPGGPDHKPTLYEAMRWAEDVYHRCLTDSPEAEPARRYLDERGIDEESIRRFRLGYAPDVWQWLLDRSKTTPFDEPILRAVGLTGRGRTSDRPYDLFRGRVLFPIRDTQDRCIAIGGRVLPELQQPGSGKYYNSPETRLFSKSDQLYGLNVARDAVAKSGEIVVVEGYTDVIMAHQVGVPRVVAVLGTALNERHVRLLKRFANRVVLVLDGDEAGRKRAGEVLELFVAADVDLRVLTLPEGLDPFDFCRRRGGDAFERLLSESVDALEHRIRTATAGIDLLQDTHAAHQALEQILATVARAPAAGLREQQVLTRLAREFRLDVQNLRTRVVELRRSRQDRARIRSERDAEAAPSSESTDQDTPFRIDELTTLERELLEILMVHPRMAPEALAAVPSEDLTSRLARRILSTITELHRRDLPTDFERVMLECEDATLKALLVELADSAHAKEESVQETPAERLEGVRSRLADRRQEQKRRLNMAALDDRDLNDQEKLDLLEELIREQRNRQGISVPTDG